jgi:hypothetical protein
MACMHYRIYYLYVHHTYMQSWHGFAQLLVETILTKVLTKYCSIMCRVSIAKAVDVTLHFRVFERSGIKIKEGGLPRSLACSR